MDLHKNRHILYVDDEPSNLVVFEAAFSDDFQIHTAETAQKALDIIEQTPIPVVIADQRMPEMTGIEMFRILRSRYPQIQRIVLSGFTSPDALVDAINEGQVFHFVHKPWEYAELLNVIHRSLDAHDMLVENSTLKEQLAFSERLALLGQSAARITHEIGNQLNLLPLVEAIEDNYGHDPLMVELGEMARLTHQNLLDLVGEIRDFVHAEQSGITLKPISINEAINDLMGFCKFNPTISSEALSTVVQGDAKIRGNTLKLQQILINLLRNASDAIADQPDGRITLTSRIEENEKRVIIEVADNGIGIDPNLIAKIWDPFFSTKQKKGTGLGLDVVRSIVKSFDGEIHCTSEPEVGTSFTLTFPIIQPSGIEPEHSAP